jgi:hypothetical protein
MTDKKTNNDHNVCRSHNHVLPFFMTCHWTLAWLTWRFLLDYLLTIPEHLGSLPDLRGVRVARSLSDKSWKKEGRDCDYDKRYVFNLCNAWTQMLYVYATCIYRKPNNHSQILLTREKTSVIQIALFFVTSVLWFYSC